VAFSNTALTSALSVNHCKHPQKKGRQRCQSRLFVWEIGRRCNHRCNVRLLHNQQYHCHESQPYREVQSLQISSHATGTANGTRLSAKRAAVDTRLRLAPQVGRVRPSVLDRASWRRPKGTSEIEALARGGGWRVLTLRGWLCPMATRNVRAEASHPLGAF
jgi:hypothetical protein